MYYNNICLVKIIDTKTKGTTGCRQPEGPGLYRPERSEGVTKGLRVSTTIGQGV